MFETIKTFFPPGSISRALRPTALMPVGGGVASAFQFGGAGDGYPVTVRAYKGNEIVSASVNLLMNSASEPHIIGRRYRRNRPQVRAEMRQLNAAGIYDAPGRWVADAHMVRNGFWETLDGHPLVTILNNPNYAQDRAELWSMVVMDYYLAGNAYLVKARYRDGLLAGAVGELWRLRPDRMKPIPGDMSKGEPYLKGYEYTIDYQTKRTIPVEDVLHFKTRDPLNPYEGVSPLVAALERVEIDRVMRRFMTSFYEHGGNGVGGILSTKNPMTADQKTEVRERFHRMFNGGQIDVLVSSAEDIKYERVGLERGLRDAVPKEIDALNEARIAMVFGIPGSIIGLLIGYESSSYANKRADFQVLWDVVVAPFLSRIEAVLNRALVPEFGGIDEVVFDLSDITALREDEDAFQERARKNWLAGLAGFYESRVKVGYPPDAASGEMFNVPTTHVLTPVERLGEKPEVPASQRIGAPPAVALLEGPRLGRPRLEADPAARALHDEAVSMRERYPSLTWAQIGARVGVAERTLREYRSRFGE